MSATVAEMDAVFNDFDADDFLEALVTPPPAPSSNKRPIDLTCDDAYDEDTTLFQTVRTEMELELKSLKGGYSDSPLHTCFDSDDGITPAPFDDSLSITGVMDNGRAPTIAEFNSLFDWKKPVPQSIKSVSAPLPVPSPVSITSQLFQADEVQVIDPTSAVVYSALKSAVQSAYFGEQVVKYTNFYK